MTAEKADIIKASIKVQEVLAELDVDMMGITSMENIKGTRLEEQVKKLLPKANSIVVIGMEVYEEMLNLTSPERVTGAASFNDMMKSQSEYINGKLTEAANDIARASHNAGLKALPIPADGYPYDARFLDTGISFKDAAEATGLGKTGYNALLVTGKYGPRVMLAVCLTEAKLKPTAKASEMFCRNCNVCIAKCPPKALDYPDKNEPYKINEFVCATYLAESGGCWECVKQCPVATKMYE